MANVLDYKVNEAIKRTIIGLLSNSVNKNIKPRACRTPNNFNIKPDFVRFYCVIPIKNDIRLITSFANPIRLSQVTCTPSKYLQRK